MTSVQDVKLTITAKTDITAESLAKIKLVLPKNVKVKTPLAVESKKAVVTVTIAKAGTYNLKVASNFNEQSIKVTATGTVARA